MAKRPSGPSRSLPSMRARTLSGSAEPATMASSIHDCSSARRSGTGRLRLTPGAGLGQLGQKLLVRRDAAIPFEQGRDSAGAALGERVERPDRLQYGAVMGVEQVGPAIARAGEMD